MKAENEDTCSEKKFCLKWIEVAQFYHACKNFSQMTNQWLSVAPDLGLV